MNYAKNSMSGSDMAAVLDRLYYGPITQGDKVSEFEKALCNYTGAKYCIVVSSGTAALHLAVKSLDIGEGKNGFTSPNTFVATANAMMYNSIRPRFVDIENTYYCMDPQRFEDELAPTTALVIPVHFAGNVCDMESIKEIADGNEIHVIEDACHALGASYLTGEKVGCCKYSDLTCFSFHPSKTITTGEGGAVMTNDEELANRVRAMRDHGRVGGKMVCEGYNYRLPDINCALGISQLKRITDFISKRASIYLYYKEHLKNCILPLHQTMSSYNLFIIRTYHRDKVKEELAKRGINAQIIYFPVYEHPYYQEKYSYLVSKYPNMSQYAKECLALPIYPDMTIEDMEFVVKNANEVCV